MNGYIRDSKLLHEHPTNKELVLDMSTNIYQSKLTLALTSTLMHFISPYSNSSACPFLISQYV